MTKIMQRSVLKSPANGQKWNIAVPVMSVSLVITQESSSFSYPPTPPIAQYNALYTDVPLSFNKKTGQVVLPALASYNVGWAVNN
jgi:hypothetical protein